MASVPTEQVPGLPDAPDKGKFFVRKSTAPEPTGEETAATVRTDYEAVLTVTGEDDYVVPLYNLEDGSIQSSAFQLLQQRRGVLRQKLVDENTKVQVVS